METTQAFELADFIVPLVFAMIAFGFTVGYATYALLKLALSGEPLFTDGATQ